MAAVALVPATASAKSKAKVYRGTFTLVGADGDYVTGNFGKVQLVDGKRNDKLSVHVRRLALEDEVHVPAPGGQLQGRAGRTDVAGWKYRALKTNRKGVGNSTARSRTFTASKGAKYFVGVYNATGDQLVLCAQLRTKGKKAHAKPAQAARQGRRQARQGQDARQGRRQAAARATTAARPGRRQAARQRHDASGPPRGGRRAA